MPKWLPDPALPPALRKRSSCSTPSPTCGLVGLSGCTPPSGCEVVSYCDFTLSTPADQGAEHPSLYSRATCVLSYTRFLFVFESLGRYLNNVFVFFLVICQSLFIFWREEIQHIYVSWIFSLSLWLCFHFHNGDFT